jgi:hypothetical protein
VRYVKDVAANTSPGRVVLAAAGALDRGWLGHRVLHATMHQTALSDPCAIGPDATAEQVADELRAAARAGLATVPDVLLEAADQIRMRGRWTGDYMPAYWPGRQEVADPARCPVCAVGAISAVVHGNPAHGNDTGTPLFINSVIALAEHVAPDDPVPVDDPALGISIVARWSDAEGRTVDQIAEAMEHAAAAHTGGGSR